MKNKDLFNAINNIDERFITDAGKYLQNDSLFSVFPNGEQIEAGHTDKRMATLKFIAPVAAAAVLLIGVAVLAKSWGNVSAFDPENGAGRSNVYTNEVPGIGNNMASSSESSSDTEDLQPDTAPETGELPITLYGPDYRQICYEDVSNVFNGSIDDITDGGRYTITCGFAYVGEPAGRNYNSIYNADLFDADYLGIHEQALFKRVYEGDTIGDLTVKSAESSFMINPWDESMEWRYNSDKDFALYDNILKLDGSITANVYLVKDGYGNFRCYLKNDEKKLPVMNLNNIGDEYDMFTSCFYAENLGDFSYYGELPGIELQIEDADRQSLERLLDQKEYQEAVVTLSDIIIEYSFYPTAPTADYLVSAKCGNIMLKSWQNADWAYVINDENMLSFIDSTETVEELEKIIVSEIGEFVPGMDMRVYSKVTDVYNLTFSGEVTEGNLSPGMIAALYDSDGVLIGYFVYRLDQLAEP